MSDTPQDPGEFTPEQLAEAETGLVKMLGGLASIASGFQLGQLTVTIQNHTHPVSDPPPEE